MHLSNVAKGIAHKTHSRVLMSFEGLSTGCVSAFYTYTLKR
jgi:hypothetical protein